MATPDKINPWIIPSGSVKPSDVKPTAPKPVSTTNPWDPSYKPAPVAPTVKPAPKVKPAPQAANPFIDWLNSLEANRNQFAKDVQKEINNSFAGKLAKEVVKTTFGPIVSVGSAVLNTLNSGAAAVTGSNYKRRIDNKQGIITPSDLAEAAMNGEKINGQKVKVIGVQNGSFIYNVSPTVSDSAEIDISRNEAAFNNATAFLRNERTVSGYDIAELDNPEGSPVDLAVKGLGYDLTHDPLLLINPVKVVKGVKVLTTGVKALVDASAVARETGLVSKAILEDIAARAKAEGRAVPPAVAKALQSEVATPITVKKQKPLPQDLRNIGGKATDLAKRAETPYEAVPYAGEANLALASGLSAMGKVIESLNAPAKLQAMAKAQVSGVFRKTPTARVIQDLDTKKFSVVDGLGETLGTFPTRKLASEFATLQKTGESASGRVLASLQDLQDATKTSAPVTTNTGETVVMERNVPHEAANGKTYVYDGESLREFETTDSAFQYIRTTTEKPVSTVARAMSGQPTVASALMPEVSLADIAKIRPSGDDAKYAHQILTDVNKAVAEAIGVRNGADEVKYDSFNELVQGIASGDVISPTSLKAILEAMDPSKKAIVSIRKAAESNDSEFLRTMLSGKGVQTMNTIQQKIVYAADFEEMIGVTGLGYKAALGHVLTNQSDPLKSPALTPNESGFLSEEFIRNAEAKESKAALAEIASQVDSAGDIATEAAYTAFKKLNLERAEIKSDKGYVTDVSVMDDIYERTSNKAWEGRAILPDQVNQVFDANVFSSIVGITRSRIARSTKAVEDFAGTMVDSVMTEFRKVDASLGLQGIRIQRNKVVTKQNAKDVLAGKDAKNTIFLHTGQIFEAFEGTGGREILKRAFFSTPYNVKMGGDSFLTQNLGEAARHILEMDALGMVADRADVVQKLFKGVANATVAPSPAFAKKMPNLAIELANHLLRADVIKAMRDSHLTKAIGLANQMVNTTKSVADNVFSILFDAMRENVLTGKIGEVAQLELLRSHLRRLAVAGDFFKLGGGPIAEAAFRSWAQILTLRGRVGEESLLDVQEWQNFRNYMNNFYRYDKPQNLTKADRSGIKKFTQAQQDAVANRLDVAMGKYELVMKRLSEVQSGTPESAAAWRKDYIAAQSRLDKIRPIAIEHNLETKHWIGNGWVVSSQYNFDEAVRIATEQNASLMQGRSGIKLITDTAPTLPSSKKLTGKELTALLKAEKLKISKTQRELSVSNRENIAAQMQAELDAKAFERIGVPEEMIPQYTLQLMHARGIVADTDIKIEHLAPEFENAIQKMQLDSAYSKGQLNEKLFGFGAQPEVKSLSIQLESSTFRVSTRFASFMDSIRMNHAKISREEFNEAMTMLRDNVPPTAMTNPAVASFYSHMKPAIDLLFGSETNSAFITNGISGSDLQRALDQMGLTARNGFADVSRMTSGDLVKWLREAPWGNKPKSIKPNTGESTAWEMAAKNFEESGMDPLLALTQFMQAVASTKFQTGMAHGFASRFSYLAEGLTYEQAINKGYVQILPGKGGPNLMIDSLPTPAEGGLFPPNMAAQYGAAMRNWNEQFNKPISSRLKTVLQIQGAVKAGQTIMAPGFQVNTFMGDAITAILRGVTNPADWGIGWRISVKYLGEKFATDYSKVALWQDKANIEARKVEQLLRSAGFEGREVSGTASDSSFNIGLIVKGKRVTVDDKDAIAIFEDSGLLEESIYKQDISGLRDNLFTDKNAFNEVDLTGSISDRARGLLTKEGAGVAFRTAERVATKLPGDVLMGHANAIRIAHALKIMRSRSWNSIQEAVDAAVREVAIYHPTAKSLAAFERKWGRAVTSYYTWMRMAHVATYRMFMENNREINAVTKALYAFNAAQGYQPQNVGSAYPDQTKVPDFMADKTGAVLFDGDLASGMQVVSSTPPIIFNDVLNYAAFRIDLSKPLLENIIGIGANAEPIGLIPQVGATITKNMAIGAPTLYELLFRRDPNGKPIETRDFNDVFDNFILPYLGAGGQALKTSGAYIQQNKRPENTTNPYTKDQQQIDLLNLLTRMRLQLPNDPKNLTSGQKRQQVRINDFIERLGLNK